jgi:hypothetical protein
MHLNTTVLIRGEPAETKLASLELLLWTIKARISLKFISVQEVTTLPNKE